MISSKGRYYGVVQRARDWVEDDVERYQKNDEADSCSSFMARAVHGEVTSSRAYFF